MKFNRRMGRYLEDLRSREVEAVVAPRGPDVQIVEAGGCFLLRGFVSKPHLSPADFPDQTGLECIANRLRMASMLDGRLVRACPLLLLAAGLVTASAARCGSTRSGPGSAGSWKTWRNTWTRASWCSRRGPTCPLPPCFPPEGRALFFAWRTSPCPSFRHGTRLHRRRGAFGRHARGRAARAERGA